MCKSACDGFGGGSAGVGLVRMLVTSTLVSGLSVWFLRSGTVLLGSPHFTPADLKVIHILWRSQKFVFLFFSHYIDLHIFEHNEQLKQSQEEDATADPS